MSLYSKIGKELLFKLDAERAHGLSIRGLQCGFHQRFDSAFDPRLVVEIAHRNSTATINWHLNNEFIGTTEAIHQKEINPKLGKNTLTLVDDEGNSLVKNFVIVK